MKILVLGAGAVGGYFGGRMAEAGMDVTFLVREKRQKKLEKSSLIIKSPKGDFVTSPNLVTIDNVDSIYDVILFTNKAYDLDEILQSPFVSELVSIFPFPFLSMQSSIKTATFATLPSPRHAMMPFPPRSTAVRDGLEQTE